MLIKRQKTKIKKVASIKTKKVSKKKSKTSKQSSKTKKVESKVLQTLKYEIDIDQIHLHARQLFLYGSIDEKSTNYIMKGILGLTELNKEIPINLFINSPGGECQDGFAIIDIIKGMCVPVNTFITGKACSMAGLISVCGSKRFMTKNSIWMGHEMHTGVIDYVSKALDRADYWKVVQKQIYSILSDNTKLSQKELYKASRGELWLDAEQCLEKGVIDVIV